MNDLGVALIGYWLAGATFHPPVTAATPGLHLATFVTLYAERAAAGRARQEAVAIVPALRVPPSSRRHRAETVAGPAYTAPSPRTPRR